jgi:hypothetical protein
MAAQKKSVDEIWKELNARTSTRSSSTGFSGVPGVATKTRILPTKTPAQPPAAPPADVQHQIDVTKRNVNYDYSKAGVTSEDIQSYLSTIQRTVNCLSDPDRSTRRQAAQTLNARLFKGDASNPKPSPQLLQGLICGPLLHPLITLLSDHVEACRSSSLTTFTQAAESAPDISDACSRLFPGLAQRMGDLPVAEPSEECRLQVVQLVAALVQHLPAAALAAYRDDLSAIMCRAFEDGYHEIKKQGCTILQQACGKLPAAGLEPQADKLLAALLPNLSHAHSKVRTAVLQALEALVAAGIPAGSMQQAVAPALKPLAVDRAPGVRETLFSTVATWLGHAGRAAAGASHKVDPSVAETYAPCLLPLLLLGTSDEQASTAAAAWQLVHSVGAALASTATTSSSTAAMDTEPSAAPAASSSGSELPASSRALVQRLLPQLLPPAIKELTEWTVALRSSAARTLHHMLLLAGQGSTGHLPALLPALCSAIGDEDVEVARRIMGCVQVLGAELQVRGGGGQRAVPFEAAPVARCCSPDACCFHCTASPCACVCAAPASVHCARLQASVLHSMSASAHSTSSATLPSLPSPCLLSTLPCRLSAGCPCCWTTWPTAGCQLRSAPTRWWCCQACCTPAARQASSCQTTWCR